MGDRVRIVLVAPVHDSGARSAMVLARLLRDAGAEVIITAPGPAPDQIVRTALQEDAVAVAVADGTPAEVASRVRAGLAGQAASDVAVIVAGPDPGPDVLAEVRAAVAHATAS
ncbi:cobalamin B12-binding domain-containing protein [Pseudonocardia sp. H11422]|uniref:cobalamin B12-binding domain-containing protein n=1 Tax=Pseudonocardia sp. H11422 TaxID=2835866 RepID=UPI001BDD2CA6|nr:methylmalonyl-CoA mutase [Pseudonocardia sp. H11422]